MPVLARFPEMESKQAVLELENGTIGAANGTHDDGHEELSKGHGSSRPSTFLKKAIWHGGSVYDAWLNAVSAQVRMNASNVLSLVDSSPSSIPALILSFSG